MLRLETIRKPQRIKARVMTTLAPLVLGARAPDIMYVLLHREELFGRGINAWSQEVMRGPSEWSVGERELFAAWVSRKNACRFCEVSHTQVATLAIGKDVVTTVLRGERDENFSEKAFSMLPFLEKLALDPDAISETDLEGPRAAGVSDAAIEDAVHVCAIFSVMNRIVFAMGCRVMEGKQLEAAAKLLFTKGYDP